MSLRLPPSEDGGKPEKEKKVYVRISAFLESHGFFRHYTIYCLCYSCCEVFINDTIMNTLLCPRCPSTLPMMNFTDFEKAIQESYRAAEIRRKLREGAPPSAAGDGVGGAA